MRAPGGGPMLDSGTAAGLVLALGTGAAGFIYLALLAGHLLRTEGLNELRTLIELQHELNRQRVHTQVDQFGKPPPAAEKVMSAGEKAVVAAIRRVLKA